MKTGNVVCVYVPVPTAGLTSEEFVILTQIFSQHYGEQSVSFYEGPNGSVPQDFERYAADRKCDVAIAFLPQEGSMQYLKEPNIIHKDGSIKKVVFALSPVKNVYGERNFPVFPYHKNKARKGKLQMQILRFLQNQEMV